MNGGLYVHFPYCEHHCSYCDFVVATPRRIPQADFTDAILAELTLRGPSLTGPAETLYLGGGTPSLWDPTQLARVLMEVRASPGLLPTAEVTLEANPNEVTRQRLQTLVELGITRISLGVQSFQDALLPLIERRHDAARALKACQLIARAGFDSYSIDLIFG
ncbi:MAG: radical SAM protein, partial [Myxococcota bacterium]|nr:radical SAM protein [Myxococcota bacterium]